MSDLAVGLIIGCARSGTSILGEAVAAHPDVTYIFEAHQIWEKGGEGPNGCHRLISASATPAVKAEIREWFARQSEAGRILVEKCPRNTLRVPYIRHIFPEARIVHIVRDGRDVACSMTPGLGGGEWRHLRPPSWQRLMAQHKGPVLCAHAWKETMEIALADLTKVPHVGIRYEDLVRDPITTISPVLDHLGLDLHPTVVAFCKKIQDYTRGSYHAQRQVKWYRDDHQVRVGRWRENLSPAQQVEIQDVLGPLLRALGYL